MGYETKRLIIERLKDRRRNLSTKQRENFSSPKLRGAWLYPAGIEREYYFFIRKIVQQFTTQATALIIPNIPSWVEEWNRVDSSNRSDNSTDDWVRITEELQATQKKLFDEGVQSRAIYTTIIGFGNEVSDFNQKQFNKFVTQILKEPVFPYEPWLDPLLKDWGDTNFQLIKGLSDDYIKSINSVVFDAVRSGASAKSVAQELMKLNKNISGYRSQLIAVDQVGKLNGQLTKKRNQEAGLDLYTWSTSGDQRVRSSHKIMNGRLCRWDNPDVYSKDGGKTWQDRGSGVHKHPGIDVRCRCGSIPYFDELLGIADAELDLEKAA